MRHRAALLSAILAVAAASLVLPGRASAVEPGFKVAITELPATFTAGAGARTVTVVASSEANRCQKVRWSLLLRVDGPDLDEVEVARVEEGGNFPVQVQNAGTGTARITDVQLDPGQLCRGRTVTARYEIGVDDDAESGRITLQAQAFNAGRTLLQQSSAESRVRGEEPEKAKEPAKPSPSPTESSPAPEESADADDADDEQTAEPEPEESLDDIAAVPASSDDSGTPSLLGPGLIVGGILVFLGVGLLLRLRLRARSPKHSELPTGFYPTT